MRSLTFKVVVGMSPLTKDPRGLHLWVTFGVSLVSGVEHVEVVDLPEAIFVAEVLEVGHSSGQVRVADTVPLGRSEGLWIPAVEVLRGQLVDVARIPHALRLTAG